MSLPIHPSPSPGVDVEPLAVNLFITGASAVVVAPLPGIMPEHVQVVVSDTQLHIRAERDLDGEHDWLLHEWNPAAYERTMDLPDDVGWPVTASVAHGQLTVTLARRGTRPDGQAITIVPGAEHTPVDAVSDVIDLRPPDDGSD